MMQLSVEEAKEIVLRVWPEAFCYKPKAQPMIGVHNNNWTIVKDKKCNPNEMENHVGTTSVAGEDSAWIYAAERLLGK